MSDTAIATIVTGIVTIATLWLKMREATAKIDENTKLTKAGTASASINAMAAVEAATEAKATAARTEDAVLGGLNGGLEKTIADAVSPIQRALDEHAKRDETSMQEINARFAGLTEYVHKRNHEVIDVLNEQSLKLDLLIKQDEQRKKGKSTP